jgi:endo-1,4-beta-xylanase
MSPPETTTLSRRALLAAGIGSLAAPAAGGAIEPTLGALAGDKGLLFGASFAVHELDAPYGAAYADLYKRECRILTSELELKMGTLRPSADALDFAPADRLLAFAKANGQAVRGHTLIWNDALPDWFRRLGPGETEHLLDAHIQTVMERYRGRIKHWDVVNEPIGPWDKLPGNLRTGVFLDALGEGYIARSFREARRADPAATLVLNEAQTEPADESGEVFRQSLLALVKRLLAEGAPIDAIGLQSHIDTRRPYDFPRFAAFVAELAALGLEIHITELDVNDAGLTGPVRERDRKVAANYRAFLGSVLQVKAVTTVVTWQLADHTSWLNSVLKSKSKSRPPRPLPYDQAFRRKAAWEAIATAFRDAPAR